MNNRRSLLIVLGAAPFMPRAAFAQSKQPIVIGWLHAGSRASFEQIFGAFTEEIQALGQKYGSQFVIEERWADGMANRLPALAQELAAKKPAVIVAATVPAVTAAAKAAPTTPIVVAAGDPLAAGLVSNLARPGGMITGLTSVNTEANAKHLELLLDAVPKLRRVGFLGQASLPPVIRAALMESARRSIARHPIEGHIEEAATSEEIEAAILRLAKQDVQALIAMSGPLLFNERRRIATLTLARRWPLVAGAWEWTDDGALLAYGNNRIAMTRRAVYYVDRILKGAKPGDLPIEQPMTFELVVNMKTANTLGIKLPPEIMVQATRVIE